VILTCPKDPISQQCLCFLLFSPFLLELRS